MTGREVARSLERGTECGIECVVSSEIIVACLVNLVKLAQISNTLIFFLDPILVSMLQMIPQITVNSYVNSDSMSVVKPADVTYVKYGSVASVGLYENYQLYALLSLVLGHMIYLDSVYCLILINPFLSSCFI